MQLGLIGLGKMGGNMRERIRRAGHEVIGFDRNPDVSDVDSLEALVQSLEAPRVVWVMVPSGEPTRQTVAQLGELLGDGDLVIDGGNSRFSDDEVNAKALADKGVGYLDCGVSGGVWGLDNGYGLMVGGDDAHVQMAMPIFDALRPEGPREEGFVHAAPATTPRWCTTASSTA
jgi:6-phosphogluconate dehydrogenase